MYFTVNILASLRFCKWYLFNELSGTTSRRPLYVATSCCVSAVLMFRLCLAFRCFNLFCYRCQAPLDSSRFVWDCKGRKFFLFRKKKIFFFISFSLHLYPSFKNPTPSSEAECKGKKTFPSSKKKIKLFSPPFVVVFQPIPSSSEAECKGRKNYPLSNIWCVICCYTPHNQLEYSKKKWNEFIGMWLTGLKWELERELIGPGKRDVLHRALGGKRFKGTIFIAAKKEKSSAEDAKINL